jgi:hypothetical protein
LHDSAGQTLTVLGMNLVQFVHKTGRNASLPSLKFLYICSPFG